MKHLCLVYLDEARLEELPDAQCVAYDAGIRASGRCLASEALSLTVNCQTQAEVDHYWSHLAAGGEEGPCGWLKDRFGLSWQVLPERLPELLAHADPVVSSGAMSALERAAGL